jgi:hypothetical protein
MTPPSRSITTTTAVAWMLNLATRILAHSFNMPEPLVHNTGVLIYTQVQAAEHRAVKTLCSVRLRRLLQALFRQP